MDPKCFDTLVRKLARARDRRALLHGLIGAVAGVLLPAHLPLPAAALPDINGQCPFLDFCGANASPRCGIGDRNNCGCSHAKCNECQNCTGRPFHCTARANNTACSSDNNPCTNDVCQNGRCTHPAKADGTTCGTDKICSKGTCCRLGLLGCSGRCVDVNTDETNCGACGRTCKQGSECRDGICIICPDDQERCPDQVCHDLSSDPESCGACDVKCAAGQLCCGGTCVDPKQDERHCGACGKMCPAGQLCCGGICFNVQNNRNHCGSCERTCGRNRRCKRGACVK